MKALFILLFAAGNILGPWLCCCVMATLPLSQTKSSEDECPFCRDARLKNDQPKKKSPLRECPCYKVQPVEMKPAEVVIDLDLDLASRGRQPPDSDLSLEHQNPTADSPGSPWLPAKLLIHGHHVMRC